jgi:hypothetical protein
MKSTRKPLNHSLDALAVERKRGPVRNEEGPKANAEIAISQLLEKLDVQPV